MLKLIKGLWLLGVLLLLLLLKLLLMLGHLSVMYATGESRRMWILKLIIWIWIRYHWLVRSKRSRNKNLWPCITVNCVGLKLLIYCILSFDFFLAIWCLFNFNFDTLAFLFFGSFNLVCSSILKFSLNRKTRLFMEANQPVVIFVYLVWKIVDIFSRVTFIKMKRINTLILFIIKVVLLIFIIFIIIIIIFITRLIIKNFTLRPLKIHLLWATLENTVKNHHYTFRIVILSNIKVLLRKFI